MDDIEDVEIGRFFGRKSESREPCAIDEPNAAVGPDALDEIIQAMKEIKKISWVCALGKRW
jgi:hypothetical protein